MRKSKQFTKKKYGGKPGPLTDAQIKADRRRARSRRSARVPGDIIMMGDAIKSVGDRNMADTRELTGRRDRARSARRVDFDKQHRIGEMDEATAIGEPAQSSLESGEMDEAKAIGAPAQSSLESGGMDEAKAIKVISYIIQNKDVGMLGRGTRRVKEYLELINNPSRHGKDPHPRKLETEGVTRVVLTSVINRIDESGDSSKVNSLAVLMDVLDPGKGWTGELGKTWIEGHMPE